MMNWLNSLFDTSGFVPRKACGAWTPEWIALHRLSDIFIWLAYLSLPLVILSATRHISLRSFRAVLWLFAAFILSCGFTHFIEALMFEVPLYRLAGVAKFVTAVVSWLTVIALIPLAPRMIVALSNNPDQLLNKSTYSERQSASLLYSLAVLIALLAVFIRHLLDPWLGEIQAYNICILAVIFAAWYGGFGPGLLVLIISGILTTYLFIPPKSTFLITSFSHQIGIGIFIFTALGVLVLGQAQRTTRARLEDKMKQLVNTAAALEQEKRISTESLAVFDSLIHHAPYGIAYLNDELRYLRVNDVYALANGSTVVQHEGQLISHVPSQFSHELQKDCQKVLDTGEGIHNRLVYTATTIWEFTLFTVPIAQNKPGVGIIIVDVTEKQHVALKLEQRVAERTSELNQQRIFVDAILEHVSEGIVACGADGNLRISNAAARTMLHLPPEPIATDAWRNILDVYEADGITPLSWDRIPLNRAWHGEEVRDSELILRKANESEQYLVCSGQQLLAPNGKIFGAVVSIRDMTIRRANEKKLMQTAADLRASNQELETFAYIASHDLQEPLRKIQAFGTRLASKYREDLRDEAKNYIDRMLDSAGRMRKLIDDLLSFSRVSIKEIHKQDVNLNTVVRDVLEDLDERLRTSGGHVQVEPLPIVRGDASQLRQVFQNLIGNALKFTRPNTSPEVRVQARPFDTLPKNSEVPVPAGAGWRITISDNGIGFEPDYTERIFELFQRLHARSAYEGTGLGLAIVRKILTRHGAIITALSIANSGATFVIDWPTT